MNGKIFAVVERGVELIASAVLAASVAFAAHAILKPGLLEPQLGIVSFAAASASFLGCILAFRAAPAMKTAFSAPRFEPLPLDAFEPFTGGELELLDEDRLPRDLDPATEALELDDVLVEAGPDSRVVRLFDRKAMPTPGQLQSRIENHLATRGSASIPDASQALSDALAELRRSLR